MKVRPAAANEFAKSLFGSFALLALCLAPGSTSRFWRVESN